MSGCSPPRHRPFEAWRHQKKIRCQIAVWAYAYEVMHFSVVDDGRYDSVCREVNLDIATDRPDMDRWFRENFDPSTGMWVHDHPETGRLKNICEGIAATSPAGHTTTQVSRNN